MNPQQLWQQAEQLKNSGREREAQSLYEQLLPLPDWALPAHIRLADVALALHQLREATRHTLAAYEVREPDPFFNDALCDVLMRTGELERAVQCLELAGRLDCQDATVWAAMGRRALDQALPQYAAPLLERARKLGLKSPLLDYLLGQAEVYLGNTDAAEKALESSISRDPLFGPAHRALAKLRKQVPGNNHVDRLRKLLGRMEKSHPHRPFFCYALFKELDDLGDSKAGWGALQKGMQLRRAQVQYSSKADAARFEQLLSVVDDSEAKAAEHDGPVPIFIVGMPRSGTTLLERILGAHEQVKDAGELTDFTCQLRWMCDLFGPVHPDLALIRAAEGTNWHELGRRYLDHTQWHADGKPFYTDKLPSNFLNVGYIAKALPQAKILHVTRDPMDVCFSNLKELFGEAYPHSYDQVEMAEHYLRYRKLMSHWHKAFPGRVLDVSYAGLVNEPERVARDVLSFCGLPWQDGIVAIENRSDAVATASSVQVREPIHNRFVGQWKAYEEHLKPLRDALERAGQLKPD
ncbi:MAG: sulfotransferase [Gammaproteobacteria bacterium]|nr:sulfotransferase [Gammaproteobacteria bacterium]